jgi:hypothetical protein
VATAEEGGYVQTPRPVEGPVVRSSPVSFEDHFTQVRITDLVGGAQRGRPLPSPAVRADGIVLAPTGARPHPLERLAYGWTHPGS